MYVTILGNAVEGFRIHGPFPTDEAAHNWGADVSGEPDWCVAPLFSEQVDEVVEKGPTDRLVEYLQKNPGCGQGEIGRALRIPVVYPYLAHAMRVGKVSRTGVAGFYRYYTVGV